MRRPGLFLSCLFLGLGAGHARDGKEDVLILNDGRILRGYLTDAPHVSEIGIWMRSHRLRFMPRRDVSRFLHLEESLSDSSIDVLYVHPLPGEYQGPLVVVTLFGGYSAVGSGLTSPTAEGASPVREGYAIGADAGIRILQALRWTTTAVYSQHTADLPQVVTVWTSPASRSCPIIWVLTGAELTTVGPEELKPFWLVQGGMLFTRFEGVDFNVPRTQDHGVGLGSVQSASASSIAFSIGGGLRLGRFSLSGRWLSSDPVFHRQIWVAVVNGESSSWVYRYDQHITLILFTLGYAPL